jgi:hypothetical protein
MGKSAEELERACDDSLAAADKAASHEERIAHLERALRLAQAAYRKRVTDRVRDTFGEAPADERYWASTKGTW